MGANQSAAPGPAGSGAAADNSRSNAGSTKLSNKPRQRLTYQESFDIRSRPDLKPTRIERRRPPSTSDSNNSISDESNSGSIVPLKGVVRNTSRVRRNRSNIKPPRMLYANASKGRGWEFQSAQERLQKKPEINTDHSNYTAPSANSSFDTETDIENEIDLILNDTQGGQIPWYHTHSENGSTSTISVGRGIKKQDETESEDEDLYSTRLIRKRKLVSKPKANERSLPTPSYYLYLTFDGSDELPAESGEFDIKKSKSIEVLDGPGPRDYFFLNYDEEKDLE